MPTVPRETNRAFHALAPLDRDSGMRIVGPIGTPNRWCRDDRTEPSNAPADSSMARIDATTRLDFQPQRAIVKIRWVKLRPGGRPRPFFAGLRPSIRPRGNSPG